MTDLAQPTHVASRTCYQKGCKEPSCAEANRSYKAGRQADNKARTQAATEAYRLAGGTGGIPSLTHGRPSTYEYQGCRCQECREVVREQQKLYRGLRLLRQLARLLERENTDNGK